MTESKLRPVKTASSKESIWRDVQLPTFRKNVTELKQLQEVPGTKVKHPGSVYQTNHRLDVAHILPFDREKALADDFAMIASTKPIVQYVTAASLEVNRLHDALTIRIASNDVITEGARSLVLSVINRLRESASREGASLQVCQDDLFRLIVGAHRQRIHGKLQSLVWTKPKHVIKPKQPLYQQLQSSIETPQGQAISAATQDHILHYSRLLESVDQCMVGTEAELKLLMSIIVKSHELCLAMREPKPSSELMETKALLPVKKLARYWTACNQMADASKRYAALFRTVDLQTLNPYESILLPSKPASPMVQCHVHAEIQLLCFYALEPSSEILTPRVIGVSKSACYLCSLFFSRYNCFYISHSHGKLYHQWTVPDTFVGSTLQHQRQKVRQVLSQVNGEVSRALNHWRNRKTNRFVPYPNESYATLPGSVLRSQLPSEISSRPSHLSSSTITADPSTFHLASNILSPSSSVAPQPFNTTIPPKLTTPPRSLKGGIELSSEKIPLSSISEPKDTPRADNDASLHSRHSPVPSSNNSNGRRLHSDDRCAGTSEPSNPPHSPPLPYVRVPPPSTIDSLEYPLRSSLTTDRPVNTHTGNLYLSFEIEAGAEGRVEVSDSLGLGDDDISNTVDIQGMRIGEHRLLSRNEHERKLVLNLHNGRASAKTEVTLQWNEIKLDEEK